VIDEAVRSDTIEAESAPLLVPLLSLGLPLALIFPAGLPILLAVAACGLAASYWIGKANVDQLYASVETPSAAFAWESVPIRIEVGNDRSWLASRDILLGQKLNRDSSRRLFSYRARIDPLAEIGMSVPVRLPRRGRWREFHLSFESTFPLGLIRWRRRIQFKIDMLALPKLGELRATDRILPQASALALGQDTLRQLGDGEFYAVREWRPGLSQRQICWKATARRQRVMVKQTQTRLDPPVHVILHLAPFSRTSNRGRSQFELAVSMTATLTEYLLRNRRSLRVTLLGSNSETWQPRHGRSGLNEVLTRLADIQPDRQAPAGLPSQFNDGSAAVFISAEKLPELAPSPSIRQVAVPRRSEWQLWFRQARALPSRSRLRTIA